MLDFDLERAQERLSVSSKMCPPSPYYTVICRALGSCGSERELTVNPHKTRLTWIHGKPGYCNATCEIMYVSVLGGGGGG